MIRNMEEDMQRRAPNELKSKSVYSDDFIRRKFVESSFLLKTFNVQTDLRYNLVGQ